MNTVKRFKPRPKKPAAEPQIFVDRIVATIKELWQLMDISYDRFIRTTDDYHEKAVQAIFQKLYDKGDIYLGEYEGWYCAHPVSLFGPKVNWRKANAPTVAERWKSPKSRSYFFRLSKYQDRIIQLYNDSPEFIQPTTRANEMLNNLLPGLDDLAVSRSSFDWGVRVPFDPDHVIMSGLMLWSTISLLWAFLMKAVRVLILPAIGRRMCN